MCCQLPLLTACVLSFSSFQFETETEGGKLRRNVLAEGNVGSGGAPAGIISLLSGQEEMFAFRRAVSDSLPLSLSPLHYKGKKPFHTLSMQSPNLYFRWVPPQCVASEWCWVLVQAVMCIQEIRFLIFKMVVTWLGFINA